MADELIVMCSGAFTNAMDRLLPLFRSEIGCSVKVMPGPSVGTSTRALPGRLRAGEPADLVILFDDAFEALTREGLIQEGTKSRLALSRIGAAVRSGAARPDISSPEALRRALLAAPSFAYSSSASGVYVATELLGRLRLPDELIGRGIRVDGERVGTVVARGEADLGFQQMSELASIDGITVLGPLPDDLQVTTVISAALSAKARNPAGARALVECLVSRRADPILVEAGLDPASG